MMGVFVQVNETSSRAHSDPIGYIIQENGCWDWVGRICEEGYGRVGIGGKNRRAHRMMYEKARGAIPLGRQLDHLCRNRKCVNPNHLEVVTQQENMRRGNGASAQHARKTHCKRGHEFTPENTYRDHGTGRGCRTCYRAMKRVARQRRAG